MSLQLANGPVSWGVDRPDLPGAPPWEVVFDEISAAGFRWCELGPPGYLPDDDGLARSELASRGLGVAGSYVFEPIHDVARHGQVIDETRRICRRIAALGGRYLVVIDLVSPGRAATAGRADTAPRLEGQHYREFLAGIRQITALAVAQGLTPVLHPHVGSTVEFEDEIERVLADTSDDGLDLCIDTGHFAYAGIDPVRFLTTHRNRTRYLHFKDVDAAVHERVVERGVPFFDAVSMGVFCPVGQGIVDFEALKIELDKGFDGPGTIEQDRDIRSPTSALEDAKASLGYLRDLGIAERSLDG